MRRHGYAVVVRDIRPEAEAAAVQLGATSRPTPAELGADCAIVILLVVDAPQITAVLFGEHGAASALAPGTIVIVSSKPALRIANHQGKRQFVLVMPQGLGQD